MSKTDFLNGMRDYICTLKGAELSREELISWIKKECADYGMELTYEQIGWIADEVEEEQA